MSNGSLNLADRFGLGDAKPPRFYRSLEEVEQNTGRTYTLLMRRAWQTMGLSGILCVDNRPTVYFKAVDSIDYSQIRILHWQFWNQGTATLLVIASPDQVRVYSGLVPPAKTEKEVNSDHRLVECLENISVVLDFVNRVETGEIYRQTKSFDSQNVVDRHLLNNLMDARDELIKCDETIPIKTLHAFLGRVVFTCYLTDRKIILPKHFTQIGADGVGDLRELLDRYNDDQNAEALLYKLFSVLTDYFNGSMFDDDIETEQNLIQSSHIRVLRRFLKAEEMSSGQMGLPFWKYNFEVIPVEAISAIYEQFIEAESPEGKRRGGAFYTPRHLAEIVVDEATEGWDSLLDKKFLDCSVGSGIFLVILFNRLAEEWRLRNPDKSNAQRATALREVIQNNLRGVDIEETACRVTCFSLYLALLDQLEPRDVDVLKIKHGKVLPKLLALKRESYRTQDPAVVFEGNFFDPKVPLPTDFDLVIGNPPWVGRNQPDDPLAYKWCESTANPASAKAPKKGQARKSFLMPNKQVAHAFMWKAPLHVHDKGAVCLLLPTKVFLDKTDKFQKGWFSSFTVEKLWHLSDLRFILFENAICPATIAKYRPNTPNELNDKIDYIIPKTSREDPRRGVISINEQDRWRLKLADVLRHSKEETAPLFWKKYYWSTPRDLRFLEKLFSLPSLDQYVGTPKKPKQWIKGQGFKPFNEEKYTKDPKGYGGPKPIWWKKEHLYLDAKKIKNTLVVLDSDCDKIDKKLIKLYCSPDQDIFIRPKVLSNQRFSWIAYCDFPVLFQDSLQSIAGPAADAKLLMFLAAVLNSKLARYYLFHTAANWGSERPKVHLFELMRVPFPLPDDTHDPRHSKKVIEEVAKIFAKLQRTITNNLLGAEEYALSARNELEPLIYEYYEIHDRDKILIEDTYNIWEPSSTPTSIFSEIPALREPGKQARKDYADLLCEVLNQWAKRSKVKLKAEGVIARSTGTGIVTLIKDNAPALYKESEATQELNAVLKRITKVLPESRGRISYLRGLTVFDQDRIHLIKPLTMRHWARTAALYDADEIAAAILSPRRSS